MFIYIILCVSDIRRMNSQAVFAAHTGMIIVGGGLIKHHICNANLMVRNERLLKYHMGKHDTQLRAHTRVWGGGGGPQG